MTVVAVHAYSKKVQQRPVYKVAKLEKSKILGVKL